MADTIETVESFLLDSGPKNLILVRITTRDGVVGWGECYNAMHREHATRALIEELAYYLKGRALFSIKQFMQAAYADVAVKRGSMEYFCAASGLEIAMWDAVGKTLGQPVYNLLGGPCRDRFRVYANGWFGKYSGHDREIAGKVEAALSQVDRGFTALKFDPFPGPWRPFIERSAEDIAVRMVAAIRKAVGPDIDLLIEAHRRLAPMAASRVEERLRQYRPFWLEEPVHGDHIEALAEVRSRSCTPIVTGEEMYVKPEFARVLRSRAADILNPDVGCCGGILQLIEIGSLAETDLIAMAPHNYNGTTVGLAATIQACAVMPNFLITEYFSSLENACQAISPTAPVLLDGHILLSDGPGIGVDIDVPALLSKSPTSPKRRLAKLRDHTEERA